MPFEQRPFVLATPKKTNTPFLFQNLLSHIHVLPDQWQLNKLFGTDTIKVLLLQLLTFESYYYL